MTYGCGEVALAWPAPAELHLDVCGRQLEALANERQFPYMSERERTHGRTAVYDASHGGTVALAVGGHSEKRAKGRHGGRK